MSDRNYHLGRVKCLLAKVNEIYDEANRVKEDDESAHYEAWVAAYDRIFDDDGSVALYSAFKALGWHLDYCDPDMDYKDDVRAYVVALREFCATKQDEIDAASDVPTGSDIADLNWVDGPPTCEGDWLIQYEAPRVTTTRTFIVLADVREVASTDSNKSGLEIALPPSPQDTGEPAHLPLVMRFPGNSSERSNRARITHSCRLK